MVRRPRASARKKAVILSLGTRLAPALEAAIQIEVGGRGYEIFVVTMLLLLLLLVLLVLLLLLLLLLGGVNMILYCAQQSPTWHLLEEVLRPSSHYPQDIFLV